MRLIALRWLGSQARKGILGAVCQRVVISTEMGGHSFEDAKAPKSVSLFLLIVHRRF